MTQLRKPAATTVPVFDWVYSDGRSFGCGTECEFNYWRSQGTVPDDAALGNTITFEPYAEDARRIRAWGLEAEQAEQYLPAGHPLLQHDSGPPVSTGAAMRRELPRS